MENGQELVIITVVSACIGLIASIALIIWEGKSASAIIRTNETSIAITTTLSRIIICISIANALTSIGYTLTHNKETCIYQAFMLQYSETSSVAWSGI